DRPAPRVRHPARPVLPPPPRPRGGGPRPVHGAGAHAEGQADLPLHVPAQERVHLLREREAARSVPTRDRRDAGLRRRLEGRRGRGARPDELPITPPPQPTGRSRSPRLAYFISRWMRSHAVAPWAISPGVHRSSSQPADG